MLFKNKSTGVVWDIVDEAHIKRLQNDSNYELVKEKKQASKKDETKQDAKKDTPKKNTTKKTSTKKSTTKK